MEPAGTRFQPACGVMRWTACAAELKMRREQMTEIEAAFATNVDPYRVTTDTIKRVG